MKSDGSILLHAKQPAITIPRDRVMFAFGDGRFTYDCVTCGAQCCKGHGYNVAAGREIGAQFASRPAIRFFLEPIQTRSTSSYTVANCPPSCFFLTEKRLCTIQLDHGYDAKPETCRLFPFNSLRRVGDHLIVTPHLSLCPLSVLPAHARSPQSSHDALFDAMSARGLGLDIPEAFSPFDTAETLLELEREIVRESEHHLETGDYMAFARKQVALTTRILQRAGHAHRETREDESERVSAFAAMLQRLFGLATVPHLTDPLVVRAMIAATPVLRSHLLFPRQKQAAPVDVGPDRLPYLLIALHTLTALAREAGMQDVTYQTVTRLFGNYRPLLAVLAYADREMVWKPNSTIDWPFMGSDDSESRYLGIVRSLLPAAQRKRGAPLGTILLEHLGETDVPRLMFLKGVARRLAGRIVPTEQAAARRGRQTIRRAVQRWMFGHVNVDLMVTVARHLSSRTALVSAPATAE